MAAFGDYAALVVALDPEPAAVNRPGGPFLLEPLLYLTFARLGPAYGGDAERTVRVLLERGADPNTGYLWDENAPPFTALTADTTTVDPVTKFAALCMASDRDAVDLATRRTTALHEAALRGETELCRAVPCSPSARIGRFWTRSSIRRPRGGRSTVATPSWPRSSCRIVVPRMLPASDLSGAGW